MKIHDFGYVFTTALGILAITIATRGSFAFLPAKYRLPARLEEALRYAPACALTAIVAPSVFARADHSVNVDFMNPRLWGLLAAGIVFYFRRNMVYTMAVGMVVFTVVRRLGA
jgi:branched-subunit amino acid transport protein